MRLFLFLVSRNGLSRFVGWAANANAPKWLLSVVMKWYIGFYKVDLSEVKLALPDFRTFNAFFTRELREGARPIAPQGLVSPVDGVLSQRGALETGVLTQIKGKTYSLAGLLGSDEEAERFQGGSYATVYLSPRDYHRIHTPMAGNVTHFSVIPGKLYPVNNLALPNVEELFNVNERWTTYFETDKGPVALVKVGATSVGAISVDYDEHVTNAKHARVRHGTLQEPRPYKKGQEVARFNLGSTIVLLTSWRCEGLENQEEGKYVTLGEQLD